MEIDMFDNYNKYGLYVIFAKDVINYTCLTNKIEYSYDNPLHDFIDSNRTNGTFDESEQPEAVMYLAKLLRRVGHDNFARELEQLFVITRTKRSNK